MTRFVPAWQRKRIAEEEARRNAKPVAAHMLSILAAKLGDMATDAERRAYLQQCVDKGVLTAEGRDYAAKVVGLCS